MRFFYGGDNRALLLHDHRKHYGKKLVFYLLDIISTNGVS